MKKIVLPGLLAGVLMLIASMLLSKIYNFVLPGLALEYENPALFRPWSDPIMSLYFLYPFILGVILAFIWDKTKDLIKDKKIVKRALKFAFYYWLVSSIPGMFITYSSFVVSLPMVISWSVSGFIQAFVAAIVLAKFNR